MARNISKAALAVTCFVVLGMCFAPSARAQGCSNALTAGKWGYSTSGTVVGIGPRSSLGIFTLDAAGNLVNGKATASLNGNVTDELFSGTYTVNPDCTGKLAIAAFDLSGNKLLTATLDLVFDDNGRQMRAMYTSVTLPNGTALGTVINVEAKRLFPESGNQQ